MEHPVVIKMLHRDMDEDEATRFRTEKGLLEHLQGHPAIVQLLGSGSVEDARLLPGAVQQQCEGDFMILEKLDMSLEERLKGSRDIKAKEDLLALDMPHRLIRVLEYLVPVASAIEFAHVVRNVCHRDINPKSIQLKLPNPKLAGSTMQVRLGDFSIAKMDLQEGVTRFAHSVPGTMHFQSPEQETNVFEMLVNVEQGSNVVEYFEDFYINVAENDTFAVFNRQEEYGVVSTDRTKKRIKLVSPFAEGSEQNVRAHIQKSVGRPADIYALGALFYYLISGAFQNPKKLYDQFHKFIEYDRPSDANTIDAYLRQEYEALGALRSSSETASPVDRLFQYKHLVDGNGETIPIEIMSVIARCMMRNKPDSYCQTHELETTGITSVVRDLMTLYSLHGLGPAMPTQQSLATTGPSSRTLAHLGARVGTAVGRLADYVLAVSAQTFGRIRARISPRKKR